MHTTKPGQCLLDVAVQYAGAVEAAWDMALAAGWPLDWEPLPGTEVPSIAVANREVVAYYTANGIVPATAIVPPADSGDVELQGVDYWIIENDFIVS